MAGHKGAIQLAAREIIILILLVILLAVIIILAIRYSDDIAANFLKIMETPSILYKGG